VHIDYITVSCLFIISAGAICWFDGGHSDSADPASFRHPVVSTPSSEQPEALQTPSQPIADWKYIRIDGLGLFPGLLCPHHDKVTALF
jgi:dipeptidase E